MDQYKGKIFWVDLSNNYEMLPENLKQYETKFTPLKNINFGKNEISIQFSIMDGSIISLEKISDYRYKQQNKRWYIDCWVFKNNDKYVLYGKWLESEYEAVWVAEIERAEL